MTAASRLTAVLQGELPDHAVFSPVISGVVARLAQLPYDVLVHSPDAAGAAYRDAARLLGLEFVTVGADPAILAEAAGATVDWTGYRGAPAPAPAPEVAPDSALASGAAAATIATAARVVSILGDDAVVAGVVPSPLLLARILAASATPDEARVRAAGRLVIAYARALCDARVSALVVVDGAFPDPFDAAESKAERVVANTARHFEIPLLRVLPSGCAAERGRGADGVLAADPAADAGSPTAVPVAPGDAIPPGAWFTSAGELDPDSRPEDLHRLLADVAAAPVTA